MKLQRLFGALFAVLISSASLATEQSTFVMPTSGPMSMAGFVAQLNPGLRAIASCNWGTAAPANGPSSAALPYQCWADTTTNPVLFKRYDGAQWVVWGALDTSAHTWTPYRQGSAIARLATSASFADLVDSLLCAQLPAQTGDVTRSAGSCAASLVNIPSATPAAGSILYSNSAAPSSPASGKTSVYTDATAKRLHDKNDAGVVGTTVVGDTGATHNFLTAIDPSTGAVSKSRPACADLSDASVFCNGTSATLLTGQVAIANGGTGQATAPAARGSSGLNVYGDAGTAYGNANQTLAGTDRMAYTNAAFTAARTWTLPAANVTGQPYTIKIADMANGVTATNSLTIARAGSDTINGSGTSVAITAAGGGYECSSDGVSKWSCLAMGAAAGGGVSSVTCGTGMSGGTITTSGTCNITGAPVLLNTLTASSSATLSDTTSLTAAYPAYEIVFEGLIPATASVTAEFQIHSGGAFQTTGYIGQANIISSSTAYSFNPTTFIQLSNSGAQAAAGPGVSGVLRIVNPSTVALHHIVGQTANNQGGSISVPVWFSGYWNTSAVIDGFQFLFSSGNIASGVIKVYGLP